jgi:elongation factor Tu
MTMPPTGFGDPQFFNEPQLWMDVQDIFQIRGRGTVVTGQLRGNGSRALCVGDTLVCDGQRWQVHGVEALRRMLDTAMPGLNIGVLLHGGPDASVLRGRTVQFEAGAAGGQSGPFPGPSPRKRRWRG